MPIGMARVMKFDESTTGWPSFKTGNEEKLQIYDCKVYDKHGKLKTVVKGNTLALKGRMALMKSLGAFNARNNGFKERKVQGVKDCPTCLKQFDVVINSRKKYCSSACKWRYYYLEKTKLKIERPCAVCRTIFLVCEKSRKVCCGENCAKQRASQRHKARTRARYDKRVQENIAAGTIKKICQNCQVEFNTLRGNKKFCNPKCNDKYFQVIHNKRRAERNRAKKEQVSIGA